jgi:hypothetical protein
MGRQSIGRPLNFGRPSTKAPSALWLSAVALVESSLKPELLPSQHEPAPVGHHPAGRDEFSGGIHCCQAVAGSEDNSVDAMYIGERIAACCARAASGHAAVQPPSSVMNSRRCMSSPKLRRWHPNASNQYFDRALTRHRNHCCSAQPMSQMGQNRRYRTPTWESALTSNSGR